MKYLCPYCQGDLTEIVMALPITPKVNDQLVCHLCLSFTTFNEELLLRKSPRSQILYALRDPRTMEMLMRMYRAKKARSAMNN
jgi:hypothetical protein